MKAIWRDTVLAESSDIVEVEGNAYFPMGSIKREHFRESNSQSVCFWKGKASYYSVVVDGETNADAAWYYGQPLPDARAVQDRVAFWRGVSVVAD